MSKRGPDLKPRKARTRVSLRERFEDKVAYEPMSGCWLWAGASKSGGYGLIAAGGYGEKPLLSHRVSWTIYRGPIPDGMFLCHKCDVPACVNPEHLFLGTAADNTADALRKGRLTGPRNPSHGEFSPSSKLSEKDVREIRKSKAPIGKLGSRYGVHRDTIRSVKSRETWRNLSDEASV